MVTTPPTPTQPSQENRPIRALSFFFFCCWAVWVPCGIEEKNNRRNVPKENPTGAHPTTPDTYIGSIEHHTQTLWVYEDSKMVQRPVTYVPGLYKIFDEILVNAADNKQRDLKMDSVKVTINPENNLISVYNNGDGVPVEVHKEEGVSVLHMFFFSVQQQQVAAVDEKGNAISTLFVSGLSDDVKAHEIHNLFCRRLGFDYYQLKYTGRDNQCMDSCITDQNLVGMSS